MTSFDSLGLSAVLNASLKRMHYTTPTPIQQEAIPLAIEGRDILGSAQTGTGKTGAFSIPLIERVLQSPDACALVLTPTRELAKQVLDVITQLLGKDSGIKTAFIIGGDAYHKQISQIKARPRIIVGTPGRLNDHLETFPELLANTKFLVLDETDRMLDMGFGVQLDNIVQFLPHKRQTLMFSATMPKGINQLASKYLNNPERVSVGEVNVVAKNIKQEIVKINQDQKYTELLAQMQMREGSVIIFVKTKHGADRMATNLSRDGFEAEALHGDLKQRQRDRVMREFRKQTFRILVATDIAARGLDVPHIEHVVNYDLPQVAEDYIHRMGRTARAGASGSALCFISPSDNEKWRAIERLLNPELAGKGRGEGRSEGRGSSFKGGRKDFAAKKGRGSFKDRQKREDKMANDGQWNHDAAFRSDRAPKPRREEGQGEVFYGVDNAPANKSFKPREEGRSFFKRDEQGSSEGARRPREFSGERAFGDRQPRERDGERSFRPRGDKPGFAPRGDKPAYAPRGDKPYAPRGDKPYGARTEGRGEGRPFFKRDEQGAGEGARRPREFSGERAFGDRPFRERDGEKSSFRPRGDKPFGARNDNRGESRPFRSRDEQGAGEGARRPREYSGAGERSFRDRDGAPGEKSFKPRGDKPFAPRGDKPYAPRGDKPFKAKTEGYKPRGDKPFKAKKPFKAA